MMGILRQRYGLVEEDCAEIVDDLLFAWHREIRRPEGMRSDRAFCMTVLRRRAVERKRWRWTPTVVPAIENVGFNPRLNVLVVARERLRDLYEFALAILEARGRTILRLRKHGVGRAALAEREVLGARQVKRIIERAHGNIKRAPALLEEHGRCAAVVMTVGDMNAGKREEPTAARPAAAIEHLALCPKCRPACPIGAIVDHRGVASRRRGCHGHDEVREEVAQ